MRTPIEKAYDYVPATVNKMGVLELDGRRNTPPTGQLAGCPAVAVPTRLMEGHEAPDRSTMWVSCRVAPANMAEPDSEVNAP